MDPTQSVHPRTIAVVWLQPHGWETWATVQNRLHYTAATFTVYLSDKDKSRARDRYSVGPIFNKPLYNEVLGITNLDWTKSSLEHNPETQE